MVFSDYIIDINKSFVALSPNTISNRRLNSSIIASYSMPTSLDNVFEKNIIILKDTLWILGLEWYVDQSIAGIQKTRWWYKKVSLSSDIVLCDNKELPAFSHIFSITRWWLYQTWQIIYFMQYFFAKEKEIIILSSSTDNKDDLDALNKYKETAK